MTSPPVDKTSRILERVLAELPGTRVSITYIMLRLRRRSFGGILIVLAILGLVPGIGILAGLAMTVPGTQMALGFRAPYLPRFVRRRKIDVASLRALGNRIIPMIERLERYVRPRWLFVTNAPMPSMVGVLVVVLGLVVTLPLPFSNFPPAVALLCIALGLLERDGVLIAAGFAIGCFALAIGGMAISVAIEVAIHFFAKL